MVNSIRTIVNNSGSCFINNFNTSPVCFPRVPNHRTESGLRINCTCLNVIVEYFVIIALSFDNLCFKSGSVNPVVRCWSKFYSSIPETDKERSNTFSSCGKVLLDEFNFRIIKSYNIVLSSYIITFNVRKI